MSSTKSGAGAAVSNGRGSSDLDGPLGFESRSEGIPLGLAPLLMITLTC
jgi:hypothetical protein